MAPKHFLAFATGIALALVSTSAHAQSASAVFSGPQNMDPGLQNGLNNITGYVAFLSTHSQMP
jgi:hypothetical protein